MYSSNGVEVYTDRKEFRTCFTLWSYDSNDRFLVDGTRCQPSRSLRSNACL